MNLALLFGFNLIVNGTLSYFTMRLLVALLRPNSNRVRVYLLSLPLLKLLIDPFFYHFDSWAPRLGINPLILPENSRNLSFGISTHGPNYHPGSDGSSIADVIGRTFVDALTRVCWITIATVSLLLLCSLVWKSLRNIEAKHLRQMIALLFGAGTGGSYLYICTDCEGATFSLADLASYALPAWVWQITVVVFVGTALWRLTRLIRVWTSPTGHLDLPHTAGALFPRVHIPAWSSHSEGIRRHEQCHARWRDPLLIAVLEIIAALYWWLPTRKLISKVKLQQEIACDRYAVAAGIHPTDYASDLLTVVRPAPPADQPLTCMASHALKERMTLILSTPDRGGYLITLAVASYLASTFFLGRIWGF